MMDRPVRTSLLLSFTAVLAAGVPAGAHAQRSEGAGAGSRRAARSESGDSTERQLRRLERRADSLARIYHDNDELTAAERRSIGDALDQTVAQIEEVAQRLGPVVAGTPGVRGELRLRMAPSMDERAATMMGRALMPAQAGVGHEAMPRGWLGIVVSGTAREPRIDHGELIVRYLTYPEIVSVEPSSPAEKAGLTPSDTLIAYDGKDVRDRDISLTRLLRPNARVLVRIRRDGRTKDVPVTIADVPSRIKLRQEMIVELRAPRAGGLPDAAAFPRFPAPPEAPPPGTMGVMERMPRAAIAPAEPMMPSPPALSGPSFSNGVAGAQMVVVTEGLGRSLGVQQGVLVVNAPVSSLAYQSGLQDGDVIVKVAGRPVRTVSDVREAVGRAWGNGERSVELECVREKRTRKVMLRW